MEVVSALVLEPAISALVENLIPKLVPYRIFGDNLVPEKWITILGDLRGVLQDVEDKKENNPALRDWLENLEELTSNIEDITDIFHYQVLKRQVERSSSWKKVCQFPLEVVKKLKLSSELEEITDMLQSLKIRKENFNLLHGPIRADILQGSSRPPSTSLARNEGVVFGRDDDKREIHDLMRQDDKNNNFGVIAIVGMGGLGKTTLARYVYNDYEIAGRFNVKAWVCVSADYDIFRISKQILGAVSPSCDMEGRDLDWIQHKLSESLRNKRFLIVLDDLWNENYEDWVALRPPFYSGLVGSRIIVTTRSHIVADKVKTLGIKTLKVLSDENCHLLFCEHACLDPKGNSVYSQMAKIIAKKCSGLPLAAMSLGGLLRNVDRVEEWVAVMKSKSWSSKENDGCVDVMSVLRLSYNKLSSQLKRCFSFMAMFPEDYEFGELEMVLKWIGAGVVQSVGEGKSKLQVGHDCFHQLVSRSLFSKSGKNTYVMYDLVRYLALEVTGRNGYIEKENPILESFKSTRHVYFSDWANVNDILNCIKKKRKNALRLQSMWNTWIGIPAFSSASMKYIRALTLHNYSKLDESFDELILLKYLDLSHGYFERLPDSITSCYNLEILCLSGCASLVELPAGIWKLQNLCHLDISESLLQELPSGYEKLQNLCHLDISACLSFRVQSGIGSLQSLSHLVFDYRNRWLELPEEIGNLRMLQTLPIFVATNKLPLSRLENLKFLQGELEIRGLGNVTLREHARLARLSDKKLEKLCLAWSWDARSERNRNLKREADILELLQPHEDLKELVMEGYGGSKFPNWLAASILTRLDIKSSPPSLLMTLSEILPYLPSLKTLVIVDCPSNALKLMLRVQLPNLRNLTLENCKDLESFPSEDGDLDHVCLTRSVRSLKLSEFPDLKCISSSVVLSSLCTLDLCCCHELESFPDEGLPLSVEKLRIYYCTKLSEKIRNCDGKLLSMILRASVTSKILRATDECPTVLSSES